MRTESDQRDPRAVVKFDGRIRHLSSLNRMELADWKGDGRVHRDKSGWARAPSPTVIQKQRALLDSSQRRPLSLSQRAISLTCEPFVVPVRCLGNVLISIPKRKRMERREKIVD